MRGFLKHIFYQNKTIVIRLLVLLFCYAYARFVFLCLNPTFFHQSFSEISYSFWIGSRFDLAVIIYTNAWWLLLELFPVKLQWHQRIKPLIHFLFVGINAFFLFLNFIDAIYLKFSGKRSGIDLFYSGKELSGQLGAYMHDYWFVLVLFLPVLALLLYGNYLLRQQISQQYFKNSSNMQLLLRSIVIGLLAFSGARGGFKLLPLNAADAAKYTGAKNTPLTLNTGFNVLMSVQQQGLDPVVYFNNETLDAIYSPVHHLQNSHSDQANLVLIVLESFGKEYLGKQTNGKTYTPFLDSLLQEGQNYVHAYANGKRSIEGIPAIVSAMPSWKGIEYLNSFYQNNQLDGLGAYLQKVGYDCSFYHGGKNGTMGFDNLISISNNGAYFGMNEYPNAAHFDGYWGIFDHHYLNYWVNELGRKKKPFYSTLFTLSSHHPYTIPKAFEKKFTGGTLPIHKSIQYVDESLRLFFQQAAKQSWFNKTVFIITADHSSENETPYFQTAQGKFQIPLLVYQPNAMKHQEITQTVSQLDILPLALSALNLSDSVFGFGTFPEDSFAVQFQDGYFQMVQYPWVYQFDGKQAIGLFQVEKDSLQLQNLMAKNLPIQSQLDKKLKAVIQQYTYRLKNNQTHLN